MRATPQMREAERKKCQRRKERVEEINQFLGMCNSLVICQTYGGVSVQLIHAYRKPTEGDEEHLILETLSDVEFDRMDLADSSAVRERCMAMNRAIRFMEPIIRKEAIEDMKASFRDLIGVQA